jgi:hypothetical protein
MSNGNFIHVKGPGFMKVSWKKYENDDDDDDGAGN